MARGWPTARWWPAARSWPAARWWRGGRSRFDLASVLFCGYLVTLPLQHAAALRNLFLYTSLAAVAASLWRREVQWPRADKSVFLLLAYALVAVAALLASQVDMARSFREVRSELLVQLYVLGFALLYVRNRPSPLPLLLALAGGFVLLTLLSVFSLLRAGLGGLELLSAGFHLRDIAPGYGLNAQFYLPILVGGLAVFPLPRAGRLLLVPVAVTAFALAVWYNTTSAVVLVSLHLIFVTLRYLHLRLRIAPSRLAIAGLAAAMAATLLLHDEGYKKIKAQLEFVSEGNYFHLLSNRAGMWAIGVECAAHAPWHGYGYGQKKVALVCSDEAYLRPARERGNFMADYFRAEDYGKVSLHNQYLENWLISGWLGALLWLAFFLAACRSAWAKRGPDGLQQLVVLPTLLIFLAGCFFNGLWEGPAMSKGLMLILALALAQRGSSPGPRA